MLKSPDHAKHVDRIIRTVGCFLGAKVHLCVGGKLSRVKDEEDMILSTAVHIVVGTPGSVLHMIHRNLIQPRHIKVLVL